MASELKMTNSDGNIITVVPPSGAAATVTVGSGGGGGGASTFVALTDTPSSIAAGNSDDFVRVNGAGNAIEFASADLNSLTDINITAPTDKQVLTYDAGSGSWKEADTKVDPQVATNTTAIAGKADKNGSLAEEFATKALNDARSWHDVTSSRALNTTYTNNRSHPINVIATMSTGSGSTYLHGRVTVSAGGGASSHTVYNGVAGIGVVSYVNFSFIVSAGETYKVENVGTDGAAPAVQTWEELYYA